MKIRTAVFYAFLCLLPLSSGAADDKSSSSATEPVVEKTGKVQEVLNYAVSLVGINYKFGGKSPETGFDCSGFVGYVFKQTSGLSLPRTALSISKAGQQISHTDLKPGDLVFFNTLRRTISHVGIYLGNNQFVHASSTRSGSVEISDLRNRYWASKFTGARRLDIQDTGDTQGPLNLKDSQVTESLPPIQ